MKTMIRKSAVIYILSLAGLFFTSCKEPQAVDIKNIEQKRKNEPLSESFEVDYKYSERTQLRTQVKAPHVAEFLPEGSNEPVMVFDKGIMVNFFDANGEVESILTARRAEIYRSKGFAEATGNVVVKNNKNEVLETERLRWHRTQRIITTNAFVKITTPKDILFGDSLVANTTFTNYKIYKIKGQFKVKEGE